MNVNKTKVFLIIILIIATLVRLLVANNLDVGTDEMIYTIIPLNIIDSGRIGTVEQSPLFFYLNDLSYKLFGGINLVSIRFWSIISGAATVLVIFLLSLELFNNQKMALLSSFLFSLSGYAIKFNYEMDMLALFLASLSTLFFIRFLKKNGNNNLVFTALFLTLAISVKVSAVTFGLSYLLIWLMVEPKYHLIIKNESGKITVDKKVLKYIIISIGVMAIVLSPIIIYNYYTYQEKGITDYYVSDILGIGNTVHTGLQAKPWAITRLSDNSKTVFEKFLKYDFLILILGVVGLTLALRRNNTLNFLIILTAAIPFLYIAGRTASANHFIYIPAVLSLYAGYLAINLINNKTRWLVFIIILIAVINTTFIIQDIIKTKEQSVTIKLLNYANKNIEDEAIIIIDPRIYRGIYAWGLNNKHYLEGTDIHIITNSLENESSKKLVVPLYYIECAEGSFCGWKPEDFAIIYSTGLNISNYFKQNIPLVAEIKSSHNFNIYKWELEIRENTYAEIDKTHLFWFQPVGWKYPELAGDYYEVAGKDQLVQGFGVIVLWINMIATILAIILLIYNVAMKQL